MSDILLKELKEQTKWLRFLALPGLKETIERNITSKDQKRIYELSDGTNSTNQISHLLKSEGFKVSHMTVYNYWKRWYAVGIVDQSEKYIGRYKQVFDLNDLNLQFKFL